MVEVKEFNLNPKNVGRQPDIHEYAPVSFQDAMARLATGVAVVACVESGHPKGLLVSSLTPLSADPPSVLFCVRKAAYCHKALLNSDRCSIAILAEADQVEAERFSRADRFEERFASSGWTQTDGHPPEFNDALISIVATIEKAVDAGTHDIFIARIDSIKGRPADPLIYFNRRYQKLERSFDLGMTAS